MSNEAAVFDAKYTPANIKQATSVFRDYRFRRYGPILIGACFINVLAVGLVLWLSAERGGLTLWLLFVAILGPVWLLYHYYLAPARLAARLERILPPTVSVSVNTDSVVFKAQEKESAVPWSMVKTVVESEAVFLLVLSPLAFIFLPKAGIPADAYDTLRTRVQAGGA